MEVHRVTSQSAALNEPILLRQDREGIAILTLNRPQARNAISIALMEELSVALAALARDPAVKVVILAAAGPAFCAGHDLKELRSLPRREAYESVFRHCSEVMLAILRLPKPVIARVQGIATAAGCQLVASCDLAVAAEGARFATPGVNIGLFCSTPMVALSRAVPRKQAMEMLLTGEPISASEAVAVGLINRAVPEAKLEDALRTLAAKIAESSPNIVSLGKEAFYRQIDMPQRSAYKYAAEVMTFNATMADAHEGITAFLRKRKPRWPRR